MDIEVYKQLFYQFSFMHFNLQSDLKIEDNWNLGDSQSKVSLFNSERGSYCENKKDKIATLKYENFCYFNELLKNKNYEKIDKSFVIELTSKYYHSDAEYYVLDPFENDGEWLNTEKRFKNMANKIHTIGVNNNKKTNENLENVFDLKYNDGEIDLIKFMPNTNDITYIKQVLNFLIDSKAISSSAYIDFIVDKEIIFEVLQCISGQFGLCKSRRWNTEDYFIYKTNELKNKVIFTMRKYHDSDIIEYSGEQKYKFALNLHEKIKKHTIKFDTEDRLYFEMYFYFKKYDLPLTFKKQTSEWQLVDKKKLDNIRKDLEDSSSNNDKCWQWLKDITEIKQTAFEQIVIPKPFKQGELINVLASGMISGLISEGTERNHIVIGGTKTKKVKDKTIQYDEDGKEEVIIKTQKMNKPYINLLLPNGEIKELINEETEDLEDEVLS